MPSFRPLLLAASFLCVAGAAGAQPVTGLYIGAGVGANFQEETRSQSFQFTTNPNLASVLNMGWGFGNGLRLEGELSFRRNEVDEFRALRVNGRFLPGTGTHGAVNTYGVMTNVLYELPLPPVFGLSLHPYFGGGFGFAVTQYDSVSTLVPLARGNVPGVLSIDDTDVRFAYQAIGGLAVPIPAVPGLAVTAEYRYFGTLRNKLTDKVYYAATDSLAGGGTTKQENHNHSILIGLRYNFGAARPAPEPAPAPVAVQPAAPARTYLVFFDWDRADLTARAREIIRDAASNSRQQQVTRLEVNGYTDRSGTAQYNQGLSMRRANAVAAELVRDGVPRGAISIHAFGESNPLVPTADGVREPQNRRVEIILR